MTGIALGSMEDALAGEQIVAEIDGTQPSQPVGVLGMPALGGDAFAVLFFGAVLRRNELGKQRNDPWSRWRRRSSSESSAASCSTARIGGAPVRPPQRHLHHQDDTIYVADSETGPDTGAHELMGITPQQEELRADAGVSAMPPAPGIVLHRGK
jgi:hypothetical protein